MIKYILNCSHGPIQKHLPSITEAEWVRHVTTSIVLLNHQLEPWIHLVSVYGGLATEMKLSVNNSFISGMKADTGTSTADLGLSGLRLRRCISQE